MATEGTIRARDNLTVDEVIEVCWWWFRIRNFFSKSDSDSSEGVSSEDSSAKETGTDNIHSDTSIIQAIRGRGL